MDLTVTNLCNDTDYPSDPATLTVDYMGDTGAALTYNTAPTNNWTYSFTTGNDVPCTTGAVVGTVYSTHGPSQTFDL